jgi:CRISPR-associated protein Csm2
MNNNEIKMELKALEGFNPKKDYPASLDFTKGINEEHIKYAQKVGLYLCGYKFYFTNGVEKLDTKEALTNSQIRNVFGEVKRIQMKLYGAENKNDLWEKEKSSFLLLKPKIAYATGRAISKTANSRISSFSEIMTIAIDKVKADSEGATNRFMNFVDFFESILAYHKAFGGRDN